MPADSLSEPWRSFLVDLDSQLEGPTELHCFGGFIVAAYYGLTRPTGDIDVIDAVGAASWKTLAQVAGKGSDLAKTHHVYLDIVTIATVPENYQARLIDIYHDTFDKLRLRAFEEARSRALRNSRETMTAIVRMSGAWPAGRDSIQKSSQGDTPRSCDFSRRIWDVMI